MVMLGGAVNIQVVHGYAILWQVHVSGCEVFSLQPVPKLCSIKSRHCSQIGWHSMCSKQLM